MSTRRPDRHLRVVDESEAPGASPDAFLGNIAEALSDPEPLSFLALANSIVATLDPRSANPLTPRRRPSGRCDAPRDARRALGAGDHRAPARLRRVAAGQPPRAARAA